MKKFGLLAMAVVMATSSACAANPEFRGLWVHNWRPGILSPVEVKNTVRWAKGCNMNVLVVQVRRVGDAYYDSSYEPRASNIQDPLFDPLACVLESCHANGLEVYGWFNVYRVWTAPTKPTDSRHVLNCHPDWLTKDFDGAVASADGQFLDPGVPEVREYLVQIVRDLITKYHLDGLMLDYVRYPGRRWGYNEKAVAAFNAETGRSGKPSPDDPAWCDWRRRQVTETVKAIRNEIRRTRPSMKLSAATICWGNCPSDFSKTDAYSHCFQDWRLWMENGLLDANMPMNYKPADQTQAFRSWLEGFKRWSYGRHVYCGIMANCNALQNTPTQIAMARASGMNGIVGFAFSQLECNSELASLLKSNVFTKPAAIPKMVWKKPRK